MHTAPYRGQPLTQREREVLAQLATGASNQEIADSLSLSINTVRGYVAIVLVKTGCSNRTKAARWALTNGGFAYQGDWDG